MTKIHKTPETPLTTSLVATVYYLLRGPQEFKIYLDLNISYCAWRAGETTVVSG